MDVASSAERESLTAEERLVRQNRYFEALDAGLTHDQANEFATNGIDIGQLRKLVAAGAAADVIAEIVV